MAIVALESLTQTTYTSVQEAMLTTIPTVPSALFEATASTRRDQIRITNMTDFDFSFRRQMTQVFSAEATPVDAIAFTQNSAIPIADAVRGFFQETGQVIPLLLSVDASKHYKSPTYWNPEHMDKKELERLQNLLTGVGRVCVVDQAIETQHTLLAASHLVLAAGATSVIAMRGRWYSGVSVDDIHPEKLSSVHSSFMHTVGRLTASHKL